MNAILRSSFALMAIAGLMSARPALAETKVPNTPALVSIEDSAEVFSDAAKARAKTTIQNSVGEGNRQVHIETYKALSAAEKSELDAASDKDKFWKDWAKAKAKAHGDRGVVVMVNRSPGHVEVLVDKLYHEHGFTNEKEQKVRSLLLTSLKEAAKAKTDGKTDAEQTALRDAGLQSMSDYLRDELPPTVNEHTRVDRHGNAPANQQKPHNDKPQHEGSGIWGYVCIGIAVLLGLWLVFGLIRAFTGGGGGGGGNMGGGGGGYGGGGGGGGFMSGLLGGMFGGMAGAWLYNSFLGGHDSSSAYGGDNYSSGNDYTSTEGAGGGDFSDDQGAGGDFGGDTGGGGGDWGGGGGDFGGGGGDGGGDF